MTITNSSWKNAIADALSNYMETFVSADALEVYFDPVVPGVAAVRFDTDYEPVDPDAPKRVGPDYDTRYDEGEEGERGARYLTFLMKRVNGAWPEDEIEDVEFTAWPPTSNV